MSGALSDSEQRVFWLDSPSAPHALPPLEGEGPGRALASVGQCDRGPGPPGVGPREATLSDGARIHGLKLRLGRSRMIFLRSSRPRDSSTAALPPPAGALTVTWAFSIGPAPCAPM